MVLTYACAPGLAPAPRLTLALVYRVYHPAIISSFITSSTWLTVVMAVSRYLAICHPLKARIIIGMRFAVGSIAVAFLFSILLNVHLFVYSVASKRAYWILLGVVLFRDYGLLTWIAYNSTAGPSRPKVTIKH